MHDGGGWFYGSSGHMIMHIVLHMLSETMTIDRHKGDFYVNGPSIISKLPARASEKKVSFCLKRWRAGGSKPDKQIKTYFFNL